MTRISSRYSVGTAVDELLRSGPLTEDELVDELEGLGLELGDDPMEVVWNALSEAVEQVGERFVHLGWLQERLRFTVDVPADATDSIDCGGVLELLEYGEGDDLALAGDDGRPAGTATLGDDELGIGSTLTGPPGWLASVRGRRAVFSLDDGVLSVRPDDRPDVHDRELAAAFLDAFEAELVGRSWSPLPGAGAVGDDGDVGDDGPGGTDGVGDDLTELSTVASSAVLVRMAVDQHALLGRRVLPPLDVLVADAGLELHGRSVGRVGTDWDEIALQQRLRRYITMHGLSRRQADALNLWVGAAEMCLETGVVSHDPDEQPRAAAFLAALAADADVTRAFVAEWRAAGHDDRELLAVTMTLAADLDGSADAHRVDPGGVMFLAATALDGIDRVDEAAQLLEVTASQSAHTGALVLLAGFMADRGDAQRAARLLRQAGTSPADDDGLDGGGAGTADLTDAEWLWRELGPFLGRAAATARRNDPCPCGSGRKYKACHQGSEQHPLSVRAAWLHRKGLRYAFTHERAWHVDHAAAAASAAGGGWSLMKALTNSEPIGDVTLHEGEVWAQFLVARASLLPDDEQLLAAQWALVERSLFDVERVGRGELRLRDLRTGDRVTVTEIASGGLRPGMLLLGRVLPVGDSYRAFAGLLPVSEALRDHALRVLDQGDPEEVAALIGQTIRPPQMSNTDGEELVFHSLTWRLDAGTERADVAGVAAGLREAGFQVDGDQVVLVRDSTNQRDTVIASGSVRDGRLVLEVNSDERADEMIAVVRRYVPGAVLAERDIRELSEVMDAGGHPAGPQPGGDAAGIPIEQQRAVMAELIGQYEQRWLDEPVPALRGMTPRDAAADPIGRVELERLLDSFPDTDDPTEMSGRRLRRVLGLEAR